MARTEVLAMIEFRRQLSATVVSYLQVVPLIANEVGIAFVVFHVPWNPTLVMLAPAAIAPS
jgi:hypothetical protein